MKLATALSKNQSYKFFFLYDLFIVRSNRKRTLKQLPCFPLLLETGHNDAQSSDLGVGVAINQMPAEKGRAGESLAAVRAGEGTERPCIPCWPC